MENRARVFGSVMCKVPARCRGPYHPALEVKPESQWSGKPPSPSPPASVHPLLSPGWTPGAGPSLGSLRSGSRAQRGRHLRGGQFRADWSPGNPPLGAMPGGARPSRSQHLMKDTRAMRCLCGRLCSEGWTVVLGFLEAPTRAIRPSPSSSHGFGPGRKSNHSERAKGR